VLTCRCHFGASFKVAAVWHVWPSAFHDTFLTRFGNEWLEDWKCCRIGGSVVPWERVRKASKATSSCNFFSFEYPIAAWQLAAVRSSYAATRVACCGGQGGRQHTKLRLDRSILYTSADRYTIQISSFYQFHLSQTDWWKAALEVPLRMWRSATNLWLVQAKSANALAWNLRKSVNLDQFSWTGTNIVVTSMQ